MNNTIIFCSFLLLAWSATAKAQDTTLATCRTANLTFYAKNINSAGLFFLVEDPLKRKTDTLLISSGPYVQNCFCNDTLASFYVNYYPNPEIKLFQLKKNKWVYVRSVMLPAQAPMVGALIDGDKYEFNDYQLVSTDKVISKLTVKLADDHKLTPIEKYIVEYKISSDQKRAIIEKKVLLKE